MPDQFTEYQIDPENSARVPAAHWEIYQADKDGYLADPQAAIDAFNAPKPKSKPVKIKEGA